MKKETLKDPVDGSVYVGGVKDGKPHGKGTCTWPHGGKYVGEFKDFQYHGQGTLTHPDGKIVKGQFKNGEFVK